MTVTRITLRVPDPALAASFYSTAFGMLSVPLPNNTYRVHYPGPDAYLFFVPGQDRSPLPTDRYWKIALCMPDVDAAVAHLQSLNIPVSAPRQFRDIGYLCHTTDPAGLTVELLQHTFGPPSTAPSNHTESSAFGGGACVGLLTLRTGNMEAEHPRWTNAGQTLVSVQPVPPGFTLHFYMHQPPNAPTIPGSDVESVERRPWLWQRPTTTLEFKHDPQLATLTRSNQKETGLESFTLWDPTSQPNATQSWTEHGIRVHVSQTPL